MFRLSSHPLFDLVTVLVAKVTEYAVATPDTTDAVVSLLRRLAAGRLVIFVVLS